MGLRPLREGVVGGLPASCWTEVARESRAWQGAMVGTMEAVVGLPNYQELTPPRSCTPTWLRFCTSASRNNASLCRLSGSPLLPALQHSSIGASKRAEEESRIGTEKALGFPIQLKRE